MLTITSPSKAHEYFKAKMEFTTGPVELDHMLKNHDNVNVVDVRAREDYEREHIPGAVNLPKGQWETCAGLNEDAVNIVYCYSEVCHLAAAAAMEFSERGYPVMELEGGFEGWKEHNFPVEVVS
jgi:rhodanese-related sulfurtransferase